MYKYTSSAEPKEGEYYDEYVHNYREHMPIYLNDVYTKDIIRTFFFTFFIITGIIIFLS